MQQVLHLLFLNHRKSLAYPENRVSLGARSINKHQMEKLADQIIANKYRNNQSMSLELKRKSNQAHGNYQQNYTHKHKDFKVSLQDKFVMRKYIGIEKTAAKEYALPKIDSRHSRHDSLRDTRSLSTHLHIEDDYPSNRSQKRLMLRQRAMRKLKKCVNAIIFIKRLQNVYQLKKLRAEQLTILSSNLSNITNKVVNKYYAEIMRQPILKFGEILNRKVNEKKYKATNDIVNNLLDFSDCLRTSSLRKDMLKFLTLVTLENGPLPHDFFCQYELLRLEFDKDAFQLTNVTETQIRMVVGIFLGIKIICNHIFYQPWNVQILQLPSRLDKKVKPVIWAYASYFYTVITSFFNHLPFHDPKKVQKFKKRGVQPMPIHEENDQFYDRLILQYKAQNQRIKSNIWAWIVRISQQVLKNRHKFIIQY